MILHVTALAMVLVLVSVILTSSIGQKRKGGVATALRVRFCFQAPTELIQAARAREGATLSLASIVLRL